MAPPTVTEGTIPFKVGDETHQTWYKTVGDLKDRSQTPVVVLHGGPGFSHDYTLPHSDLATSASIPVIFYDQLGQSRSTHLPDKPSSFWNVDLFIDELVNLLIYFGIQDNFNIVGHSWGGMLALDFEIRRQPAGLKRLVISDSLAAMSLWNESNDKLEAAFPEDVQEALRLGFKDLPRYRDALNKFNAVHGCTVKPFPEELNYSLGRLYGDDGDRTVTSAMFSGELKDWSVLGRLHLVRVPTFIINGRADMAQDFVVEPLFWGIEKAKWVTFELSSHTPMWEEREKYMELVVKFLKA